jgi:hypothetical protein
MKPSAVLALETTSTGSILAYTKTVILDKNALVGANCGHFPRAIVALYLYITIFTRVLFLQGTQSFSPRSIGKLVSLKSITVNHGMERKLKDD